MNEYICPQCEATVEQAGLCWPCKTRDERNACLAMSDQEVEKEVNQIIANIEQGNDTHDLFMKLFCYRNINTSKIAEAAFAKKIFYPAELYFDALPDLRDKMIKQLNDTKDEKQARRLIYCLAMQGDDQVLKAFVKMEAKPRPWQKNSLFKPFVYTRVAGWSFNKEGVKLDLTFPQCYRMIAGDKNTDKAVRIAQRSKNKCPNCKCQLVDILTIDGTDERLQFLGIKGIIKAIVCPSCVSYEPIYCKYKINGNSKMLPFTCYTEENFCTEEKLQGLENNPFVLSTQAVNPFFGCYSEDINTIGGMPHWVQDTEYHSCPSCKKKMKFLAQINFDTMQNSMEGSLFLQICTDCQIICMAHQQM